MAIKGKKRYSFYLDEEKADFVKGFLSPKQNQGGFSGLLNEFITDAYNILKESNFKKNKEIKLEEMIKLVMNGIKDMPKK